MPINFWNLNAQLHFWENLHWSYLVWYPTKSRPCDCNLPFTSHCLNQCSYFLFSLIWWCQSFFILLNILFNITLTFHLVLLSFTPTDYYISCVPYRLNGLKSVTNESLEVVNQVTLLDIRDNRLQLLDLSSVSNLETLYCQRNQLGTLTLSGFTLRLLNASSNCESHRCNYHCCRWLLLHYIFMCIFSRLSLLICSSLKHSYRPSRFLAPDYCLYLPTGLTSVSIYPVPNQLTHMDLSQWVLVGKRSLKIVS